ncbi:hypothetical protein BV511_07650 [Methylorubrum extorquens]|uniref:hypothetical protein n=1 Tax=Methylorubrum extorquens TaxID=408 RepID=UPI000972D917|nr:hypothetical protein [Methylorubrum extorquens]APX84596.1 hypothetical protein BV511_07650 [Methylorubrum extorquens]
MNEHTPETDGAATILAMHAMVTWLVRREVERGDGAGDELTRHMVEAMLGVVQVDPELAEAAHEARDVVARVVDTRPMLAVLN